MNNIQFTKRENQIMEILWTEDKHMSASDIQMHSEDMSIYTIQQSLQKLLDKGYVEVAEIVKNKKANTRMYCPTFSRAEYIETFIEEKTGFQLTTNFIQKNEDIDTIRELENLIQNKLKELEKK